MHLQTPVEKPPVGLLRGRGFDLGPYARRYEMEERSMLRLLRDQAHQRGDKTWLVFDGTDALTFGDAYERANEVANALVERVSDGGQVALFLRNQVEFFPAFYGAMAAGCMTVPLNAEARGPLLEYVIAQSQARVLISRADLIDRLGALDSLGEVELVVAVGADDTPAEVHGAEVISWDTWLTDRDTTPPRELPKAWDTCLIQFTSGTTGRSKGVVYPNQFLYLYSAMVSDSLERSEDDVLMTPLPVYHVAALHIVANSALHAGCTAHLKSRFSASAFWEQAAEDGATFSIILGPMAEVILKTVSAAPSHRMVDMFCVPFPPSGEEFQRRYGVELLWQGYGMTEVYTHPMPKRLLDGVPYDTIGHPVSWVEYGVVDERDRLLPPDTVGQLVYRPLLPHAMFKEYFRAPDATVEAFRNFMFHTGDLATYDETGAVHYKGRRQDRIRRRGENVSATELEYVALSHEHVVEAAAYGTPGELGEHDVKLDVILKDNLFALDDLHEWLRERLPRYMVPRYLEIRESFPKTPSERIEKYKLQEQPVDRPEVRDYEPDRN